MSNFKTDKEMDAWFTDIVVADLKQRNERLDMDCTMTCGPDVWLKFRNDPRLLMVETDVSTDIRKYRLAP